MTKEARLNELQQILDQKDAEVRLLKDKVTNALQGFENSGLNVYEKNGKVYVSMNDKLLFASANGDLKQKEKLQFVNWPKFWKMIRPLMY